MHVDYIQLKWPWTADEPLYFVSAAWPFVNMNIFRIGVVKVTLNVSTAQQLAPPPPARIIYEFKEPAWDWHTVANEVVIHFIWTQRGQNSFSDAASVLAANTLGWMQSASYFQTN